MIVLRPMDNNEYPGFLDYFIADYAREIASNYQLSFDDSLARAKKEIAEDLFDGVKTPGQILLCLIAYFDNTERHAGSFCWL